MKKYNVKKMNQTKRLNCVLYLKLLITFAAFNVNLRETKGQDFSQTFTPSFSPQDEQTDIEELYSEDGYGRSEISESNNELSTLEEITISSESIPISCDVTTNYNINITVIRVGLMAFVYRDDLSNKDNPLYIYFSEIIEAAVDNFIVTQLNGSDYFYAGSEVENFSENSDSSVMVKMRLNFIFYTSFNVSLMDELEKALLQKLENGDPLNTGDEYAYVIANSDSVDFFDHDECQYSTHNCSEQAVCTNTIGSFACSCLSGFQDLSDDPICYPGRVCEGTNLENTTTTATELGTEETATEPGTEETETEPVTEETATESVTEETETEPATEETETEPSTEVTATEETDITTFNEEATVSLLYPTGNLCNLNPCTNGSICSDVDGEVYCECPPGLTGEDCSEEDPCIPNPCFYGGTCFSFNMTDGIYCECPPGLAGNNCSEGTNLENSTVTLTNSSYMKAMTTIPPMSEVTVCYWIQTLDTRYSPLSYSSGASHQEFAVLSYGATDFRLFAKNVGISVNFNISDGLWHIVCVSWYASTGRWSVYKDGILSDSFVNETLAGENITGEGVLIIGQEQTCDGGCFNEDQALEGTLGWVNMWDRTLSYSQISEIAQKCFHEASGNILSWINSIFYIEVDSIQASNCIAYLDVKIKESALLMNTTSYAVVKKDIPPASEITTCFWIKTLDYEISPVSYASRSTPNEFSVFSQAADGVLLLYVGNTFMSTDLFVSDNTWHYVCMVWTSSEGRVKIYNDGEMYGHGYGFMANYTIKGGGVLVLGKKQDCFFGCFDSALAIEGYFAGFRLWLHELSPLDIALFASQCSSDQIIKSLVSWKTKDIAIKSAEEVVLKSAVCGDEELGVLKTSLENQTIEMDDSIGFATSDIPSLSNFSVCYWIKTTLYEHTPFSYSTETETNEFKIVSEGSSHLTFYIGGESISLDNSDFLDVSDGNWHFLCVIWHSRTAILELYKDGLSLKHDFYTTSMLGKTISGGGILIFGQEQGCFGGCFEENLLYFEGELTGFNMWDYAIDLASLADFESRPKCTNDELNGNVISWINEDIILINGEVHLCEEELNLETTTFKVSTTAVENVETTTFKVSTTTVENEKTTLKDSNGIDSTTQGLNPTTTVTTTTTPTTTEGPVINGTTTVSPITENKSTARNYLLTTTKSLTSEPVTQESIKNTNGISPQQSNATRHFTQHALTNTKGYSTTPSFITPSTQPLYQTTENRREEIFTTEDLEENTDILTTEQDILSSEVISTPVVCNTEEFDCKNNFQCHEMSVRCNGHSDCSNGLDELDCVAEIEDILAGESGNVNVSIICDHNCELYYVNTNDAIILQANCYDCGNITSHLWSIQRYENGQTYLVSENITNTGLNTSYLSLKPGLMAGTYYKVILNVSTDDGGYGTDQLVFVTNTPPYGGNCTITPQKGKSLSTIFTIDCDGWLDQNVGDILSDGGAISATESALGLEYTYYYRKRGDSQKNVLKASAPSTSDLLIPGGKAEYDHQVDVIAKITDQYGSYAEYTLATSITVEPNEVSIENLTIGGDSLTDQLLQNNDADGALLIIITVSEIINDENSEDEQGLETVTTEETRIMARQSMINQTIQALELISTIEPLSQAAKIVKSITEVTEEVSEIVEEQSANALETVANILLDISDISVEAIILITTDITEGVGNVFKSKQQSQPTTAEESGNNAVSSKLSTVLDTAGTKMLQSMAPGQQYSFNSPAVKMILRRMIKRDADRASLTAENGVGISLPAAVSIFGGSDLNSILDMKLTSIENGIFVDSKSYLLNGKSITFSLHDYDSNTIEVSYLEDGFILVLPKSESSNDEVVAIDAKSESQLADKSYFFVANVNVPEKRMIFLKLMGCKSCDSGTNVTAYVGNKSTELFNDYLYSDSKPCADSVDQVYTFIIPTQYVIENKTYIGIQQSGPIDCELDVFTTYCDYWDPNTKSYQSDGCYPLEISTRDTAYCSCNHLTTFISGFSVYPPEPIDWQIVLTGLQNLHDNAAVFSVIFIIVGFYLFFIYFAWKADHNDSKKWKVNIIQSTIGKNPYLYQIYVYTGVVGGAGTTSKISLILTGERGQSEVICLNGEDKKGRKALPRGSECQFLVGVPTCLGTLQSVRIWHDNSGTWGNRSWYLNKIAVIDVLKKERFSFLCERWLAIEEGDGMVERVLRLASETDLKQVRPMFSNNAHLNLNDGHLWISVFSRPRKSRFTRVQRLSCCISLLYSAMMVNCMWYQETKNSGNDSLIDLGPIRLSWKAIYIGLISSLIVFPVNLLIVQIFRKSRPSSNNRKCTCCLQSKSYDTRSIVLALENDEITDVAYENELKAELNKYCEKEKKSETAHSDESLKEIREPLTNENNHTSMTTESMKAAATTLPPLITIPAMNQPVFLPPLNSPIQANREKDSGLTGKVLLPPILKTESKGSRREIISDRKITRLPQNNTEEVEGGAIPHQRKTKRPFLLPHCFVYVGWFLVVSTCLVSASLTIAYSLQWGATDSNRWLLAFFVSFCEDVILLQPIKVITVALILTIVLKQYDDNSQDVTVDDIYYSEKMKIEIDEKPIMTNDVSPERMEELKQRRAKETKMQSIIKEIIVYLVFLILLWFIAYSFRDPEGVHFYGSVENTLFETDEFEEISGGFDALYEWMNEVMLPGLYATEFYNGDALNSEERGLFGDLASLRLGPPKLRQLRVKEDLCTPLNSVSTLVFECLADYTYNNEETKAFGENWQRFDSNDTSNYTEFWQYQTEDKLTGLTTYGTFSHYRGGGYAVELGLTKQDTQEILDYLWNTNWLDDYTRALFIEFNLYNPNVDMYSFVKLLLEYPSTGGALPNIYIKVLRLSEFTGSYWVFILVLELTFVALLIYYFVKDLMKMIKQKSSYFTKFWNIMEVIKLGVCVTAVIFYALKTKTRLTTLSGISNTGLERYTSLEKAAFYDEAFGYLMAFVVFFSTLKMWHYLRFYKRMALMYSTLQVAAGGLLTFFIMFLILFLSFGQLFYLAVGSDLAEYHSIGTSLETLFSMWLGVFEFHSLQQASRIVAPAAFFFFSLVVYAILTFFFLTIIIHAFHEVKHDNNKMKNDYEILQFLSENIRSIIGLNKKEENKDNYEQFKQAKLDHPEDNLEDTTSDAQLTKVNQKENHLKEEELQKTVRINQIKPLDKEDPKSTDTQRDAEISPEKLVENSGSDLKEGILSTDKLDLQLDKILEFVLEGEIEMKIYYRKKRRMLEKLLYEHVSSRRKKETDKKENLPENPNLEQSVDDYTKSLIRLNDDSVTEVISVMNRFFYNWSESRDFSWGGAKFNDKISESTRKKINQKENVQEKKIVKPVKKRKIPPAKRK